MKKSTIYLGASAAILAVAGAFTTKGSTKVKTMVGWTIGCLHAIQTTCANTETAKCKTSNGTTLYTKRSGIACVNILRTGIE